MEKINRLSPTLQQDRRYLNIAMKIIFTIVLVMLTAYSDYAQTAQSKDPPRSQQPVEKKKVTISRGLGWIHLYEFQIPATLLKALESNPQFKGWKNSGVYYSPYGDRYSFDVTHGDTVRTYMVNLEGESLKETSPDHNFSSG